MNNSFEIPAYINALSDHHPVKTYFEESILIKGLLAQLASFGIDIDLLKFKNIFNHLSVIEKRFARKENQLFPYLEKRGWMGPSHGMWMFHDAIRRQLKDIRLAIADEQTENLIFWLQNLIEDIQKLLMVEEQSLFPMALKILDTKDWEEMAAGESEIGWMHKTAEVPPVVEVPLDEHNQVGNLNLDHGNLSLEQISLMFSYMPVDITFVDEKDKVRFYNRGSERVFPRSPGVIGREVRFCHPPKSVDLVLKILEEFKAGRQNTAEFWIDFKQRKIHIRYFAVRDKVTGAYKGVIEVSQDITDIQKIQGQKRLLDWEIKDEQNK